MAAATWSALASNDTDVREMCILVMRKSAVSGQPQKVEIDGGYEMR
jgi:hypothetical protein